MPSAFICYAKHDAARARELHSHLEAIGVNPWLDKEKLRGGDDWKHEISQAVSSADVFVVLLRPGFDDIGFRQQEVRWAIEALQLRPPGRGFIIPFIVEPCSLPTWCRGIHAGSDLSKASSLRYLREAIEKQSGVALARQPVKSSPKIRSGRTTADFLAARSRGQPRKTPRPTNMSKDQLRVVKLPQGAGEIAVPSQELLAGRFLRPVGHNRVEVELEDGAVHLIGNGLGLSFATGTRVAVARWKSGLLLAGKE